MDYVPPEKPVLIAKVNHALLAEYHQHTYKFIDIGKMSQMLDPGDWESSTTFEQREYFRKHGLRPGQRVVFAHPETGAEPFFYVWEHKPCSATTYAAFSKLVSSKVFDLSEQQLQSIAEILQAKANTKVYRLQANVAQLGGRTGINLFSDHRAKDHSYIGRSFFFVSDPKKRIIEEYGYDGAKGHDHWRKEAEEMVRSVEFVKPEK